MKASCRDGPVAQIRRAVSQPRTHVVDVHRRPAVDIRRFRIRREGGGHPSLNQHPIDPLGMRQIRIIGTAQRSRVCRCRWHRGVRHIGISTVVQQGLVCLDLRDSDRIGQSVGEVRGIESRIDTEGSIPRVTRIRIPGKPGSETDGVVAWIVGQASGDIRPIIDVAGTQKHRNPSLCHQRLILVGRRKVNQRLQRRKIDIRQYASVGRITVGDLIQRQDTSRGKHAVGVQIIMKRQTEQLEIVLALSASRRLARLLYGGQEQGDQNGDDCDHHQKLDQCKGRAAADSWWGNGCCDLEIPHLCHRGDFGHRPQVGSPGRREHFDLPAFI